MIHFLKYKEFVNEGSSELFLYRNTDEPFLLEILKKGKVYSRNKKFVSLSKEPDSGGLDEYGNVRIIFNGNLLFKEGAIEIYYDDPEFWEEYPEIAKHVTGFRDAKDYYKDKGYKGPEEANENGELTWEQYCEGFSDESEVVIPFIKMMPNLISSIQSKDKLKKETIDLLAKFNISI